MNLDLIKNNTKWEEAANSINSNFNKTNLELTKIAASSVKHKGYFTTEAALLAAQPSPKVGDNAYVGATYPGVVYICNTAGMWTATTTVPSPPAVDLTNYYDKVETDTIIDTVEANITSLETNLTAFGRNLYNNLFINEGYIRRSDGKFTSAASYHTTDYLIVDKPTHIKFKGYGTGFVAQVAFYDESFSFIGSLPSQDPFYGVYTVLDSDLTSLETSSGRIIKYARFCTDTNDGYIYMGITVAPLFSEIKTKASKTELENSVKALNGNIFTIPKYYIERSTRKLQSTNDANYVVSPIVPIDRKNNIVYKGYRDSTTASMLFLDEKYDAIFALPVTSSISFILTPSDIDAYEQDLSLNPDGKVIHYFIAGTNIDYQPDSYCNNESLSSLVEFINANKNAMDSINSNTTLFRGGGVISDINISFSSLNAGSYRLDTSVTGQTFADLPAKEKDDLVGNRSWLICKFKIDYGAAYLLKKVKRNESYPEFYIGYMYYGMSAISWQTIRTDISLKNSGQKIAMAGDSIMSRLISAGKDYIKSRSNFTILDCAISGSTIAYRSNALAAEWNPKSMVYRTDPENLSSADYINVTDVKKIYIWMGINDRSSGVPLGDDGSVDIYTIMGAMRKIVNSLLTQNATLSICFVTPNANPNVSQTSPTLEDYANRIKSGCRILNVECIDLFHESCINEINKTTAFAINDTVHPSNGWLLNVAADKFVRSM